MDDVVPEEPWLPAPPGAPAATSPRPLPHVLLSLPRQLSHKLAAPELITLNALNLQTDLTEAPRR